MRNKRYFERGGRGVYKCAVCERGTRRVDQGGDSDLCPECWELAGIDNSVNDSHGKLAEYEAERDRLLAAAVKKGGNAERIKNEFGYLWPQ